MAVTVADAARNNAELCALVTGAGSFADDAWTSPARTRPRYPDAVTLVPGVDASALLGRIETGPGASVKDSFADLDLAPFGFVVLFAAEWIVHPSGGVGEPGSDLPPGVLVSIGTETWSAVVNRSETVVGVSNVATADGASADDTWTALVAAVVERCPGLPIVGYEPAADIAVARRAGFASLGPLRIWQQPERLS
jgi:hypothetical protein